ncbi:MAG: hypothetical protein LBQ80_00735 [Clostridium sp.]|jgi:hypothetical protein|nr:hypothetical protein [Clostridium sp.]
MSYDKIRSFVRGSVIVLAAFCLPYAVLSGQKPAEPQVARYVLREYNGGLAVFTEQGGEPLEKYDVPVDSLPELDRELLREGLWANGREELRRLVEDYTG